MGYFRAAGSAVFMLSVAWPVMAQEEDDQKSTDTAATSIEFRAAESQPLTFTPMPIRRQVEGAAAPLVPAGTLADADLGKGGDPLADLKVAGAAEGMAFGVDGAGSPGLFNPQAYTDLLAGSDADDAGLEMGMIGSDDRFEVGSSSSDPRIGQLVMTNGKSRMTCSGSLIAPRFVLTAAHCVVDMHNGGFERGTLTFVPGRTRNNDPIGHYYAKRAFVMKYYDDQVRKAIMRGKGGKNSTDQAMADIAVVELERAPANGGAGTLSVVPTPSNNKNLRLVGYPGDKDFGTKWRVDCEYRLTPNELIVAHNCDSFGGMSGGPALIGGSVGSVLSGGPSGNQPHVNMTDSNDLWRFNVSTNLKAGNIFRWQQAPHQIWNDREIGNYDWLAVWTNWDNLQGLFPNSWTPNQKQQAEAVLRRMTMMTSYNNSGNRENYVVVQSKCRAKIWFAGEFDFGNGTEPRGWWDIQPGKRIILTTRNSWFSYFADDEGIDGHWGGDRMRTVRGDRVGMKYKDVGARYGYGTHKMNLKC